MTTVKLVAVDMDGTFLDDLEMLRQSGFSFAMGNAPQPVMQAARYVASSNHDQGVLQVIEQMLAGEGPFSAMQS